MFTGIVETLGRLTAREADRGNLHLTVETPLAAELKIDQSVAHNGICLTVVACDDNQYTVTAVGETIEKTTVGNWQIGDSINLERAMQAGARLDGHFVQGHVDQTAVCTEAVETEGSWRYRFSFEPSEIGVLVPKGSIAVDGTSLTVVDAQTDAFSVAIIPYTHEHTVFHRYRPGTKVNLEFDMMGKYITRLFGLYADRLRPSN